MESLKQNLNFSKFCKRVHSFSQGYRQNIAILADDKEEITHLLNEYILNKKNNQLIHIHLDPTYLSKKDVVKSIAFCLLSEYSTKTANLDQLIPICSETLPKSTTLIKNLLQNKVTFSDLLSLINEFIQESNRNCVLIIEEFIQTNKLFKNFYQLFSNFAISQRKCMLVVTSSLPEIANKTLGNELNLLFGNFEKIYLNESNFFQNFLTLKENLESYKLSPILTAFFVNIIGNNKTYYQAFLKSIKKHCDGDEKSIILNVLEDTLLKKETYLFQKFNNKINQLEYYFKNSMPVINTLILLSKGYMRKNNLRQISESSNRDLTHKLNKLVSLNYLHKHGNIYKIKDKLFSFWLAHIFKYYSVFPVSDIKKRRKFWQQEITEEINIFKEEFLKNRLKKILELFTAFGNDSLSIDKDKYTLPRLEKVKIVSFPEDDFHLLVGEGKKIVFAGIKEKTADDQDIFNFIQKGSNIKGKNIQKIFISLDRLTDTAKLLAKNKKIPVWDRKRVNYLLDIYNKPNFLQYL